MKWTETYSEGFKAGKRDAENTIKALRKRIEVLEGIEIKKEQLKTTPNPISTGTILQYCVKCKKETEQGHLDGLDKESICIECGSILLISVDPGHKT